MLISYDEALKLASKYLSSIDNVNKFCRDNNIKGYQNVINIKNGKTKKRFPLLISKILSIFGNNVTIETFYEINNYTNGNKT